MQQLADAVYKEGLVMCNPRHSSYVLEDQIADREDTTILGPRHNPYPFEDFIYELHQTLDDYGFNITHKCLVLSHLGTRLFGSFVVEDRVVPSDIGYCKAVVGFRASHDQSVSQQINAGDWVLMCDNMMMGGTLGKYRNKQTTFIDKREYPFISSAVVDLRAYNQAKSKRYQFLADTTITPAQAHDLLVTVFRAGGISKGQLADSIEEYHNPLPFTEGDSELDEPSRRGTAWGAWNAMTSSIQGSSPAVLTDRSQRITQTVDEYFKL